MKEKLEVLKKIASYFNEEEIRYGLGSSCLLFLHGLVEDFHDLDIMVYEGDIVKAKEILDEIGERQQTKANQKYGSRHFYEYLVEGTEVDLMGDFLIRQGDGYADRSLKQETILHVLYVDDVPVSCMSLEDWLINYRLMGREAKVKILEDHFKGERSMNLFLWYPKCSTCRKAKKYLDDHHIAYTLRDIKEDNPSEEELLSWQKRSGLPLKRFFNTSGMIYRELSLKDKLPEMSEEEMLELLSKDGMLVKRPLFISDDLVFAGFREEEYGRIKQ